MLTSGRSRHVVAPPISFVVIYAKARPSVFGPEIFNVPFSNGWGTPHQNWREDFFMRNKGSFYHIWNDDGKMVHVTEDFLNSRRCGTLSRVESVTVSKEVENVCTSLRTLL